LLRRPGSEYGYVSASTLDVKNEWSYTSSPPMCLRSVYVHKLTFHLCVCTYLTETATSLATLKGFNHR